jgi:hypothetical protein
VAVSRVSIVCCNWGLTLDWTRMGNGMTNTGACVYMGLAEPHVPCHAGLRLMDVCVPETKVSMA